MARKSTKTNNSALKKGSDDLLLIFTRNPELGKCKTRLAATVGDKIALDIYNFLLAHTFELTKDLSCDKYVFYSEEIWEDDIWDTNYYTKHLQQGIDLGERMLNAFTLGFKEKYERIIIIGSDMFDLNGDDINTAFEKLRKHDYVVGPAHDGGFYLLGMKTVNESLFQDKVWGTGTVLKDTLKNLEGQDYHLLDIKNDVDTFEDIEHVEAFEPFLKK